MLITHKDDIIRVNFWCVNDGNSWKNDFPIKGRKDYATLVDRNNQVKPVVQRIIELVQPQSSPSGKALKRKKK